MIFRVFLHEGRFRLILPPPVVGSRVKLGNHPAGGFFEKTGDECVHKCRESGHKELEGETKCESHMLQEGFIDRGGVREKNALYHVCLLVRVTFIGEWMRFIPNYTGTLLIMWKVSHMR